MNRKLAFGMIGLALVVLGIPSSFAADDEAYIQQVGLNNLGVIFQVGGTSDLVKSVQNSASNNTLYVDQDQGNFFSAWPFGGVMTGSLSQSGNWGFVRQGVSDGLAGHSELILNQQGNNILIGVDQNAIISENYAAAQWLNNGAVASHINKMVVNQSGGENGSNVAGIRQLSQNGNEAYVTQNGNSNSMAVWQDGGSAGDVNGNNHPATNMLNAGKTSVQIGSYGFSATQKSGQFGNTNKARLVQMNKNDVNGSNTANISQVGNNNQLAGASKTSDAAQVETGLAAKQITIGGDNLLNLIQTGDSNIAGLYQDAKLGNTANIYQSGFDTAAVYQSAGSTNSVTIIQ